MECQSPIKPFYLKYELRALVRDHEGNQTKAETYRSWLPNLIRFHKHTSPREAKLVTPEPSHQLLFVNPPLSPRLQPAALLWPTKKLQPTARENKMKKITRRPFPPHFPSERIWNLHREPDFRDRRVSYVGCRWTMLFQKMTHLLKSDGCEHHHSQVHNIPSGLACTSHISAY